MSLIRIFWCFLLIPGVWGQQREIGILGGGGFLKNSSVTGGPSEVSAGFGSGLAAGVVVGQDLYSYWSGEIRYLFERRDARLRAGGTVSGFSSQAHVVDYNLILHARSRSERFRPYVAVGGGVKVFRGTGVEMAYRPLMEYAYLTRATELKPMVVWGVGVKFAIGKRMMARIDFRDQITGFPQRVITPAPGMTIGGLLHDFVPTAGFSWTL